MIICVYNDCISYDAQGNPVSYLGHTLAWEKGRQLKSFDSNTYTYNANGIRTSKTVNGVKHTYTLDGTKILKEEWAGNVLIPLYDNEDAVCGIIYNDTPYYFEKNLQGDVISIVNADSNLVARYTYDAWGVCTHIADANDTDLTGNTSHIANINPFRYRGYYFDNDINLYYLQSRYYNPNIGRFLNADSIEIVAMSSVSGEKLDNTNVFQYCNNPIMENDESGHISKSKVFKVISYILDFFVKIGQTAASHSRDMEKVIKKLKKAKSKGSSKIWITELKTKKKNLLEPKLIGLGKLNFIAKALGIISTLLPYMPYIKQFKDGVLQLAELFAEIFIEVIGIVGSFLAGLICKCIPSIGFLLSWAVEIVIDVIIDMIFSKKKVEAIKKKYSDKAKNFSNVFQWIGGFFDTFKACY